MRLPDGKAAILYCVYEAVSNSFHAIEDRFGDEAAKFGAIDVNIGLDDNEISEISIKDNGIGLNESNLHAFETCDTRNKKTRGGKGIGRLVWIKTFGKIQVKSDYLEGENVFSTTFLFNPQSNIPFENFTKDTGHLSRIGTTIYLSNIRDGKARAMKRASFLRDMALHFFSYFIADSMPQLTIKFGDSDAVDLREYITGKIEHKEEVELVVPEIADSESLKMTHIYVNKTISKELRNSILLVAHNRHVEQIPIGPKFSLNLLAEKRAYIGLVRGPFLDSRVDQERTGFKITDEQHHAVHRAALDSTALFLNEHIEYLRKEQKVIVSDLIDEHPQIALKVGDLDTYVANLSPGMGEEEIGKTLFALLYRDERKIAKEVEALSNIDNFSDEAMKRVTDTLNKIGDQAKHRLAEYVVKRRQIIDLAKSFLRKNPDGSGKYHKEKVVHDLIIPMQRFYGGEDTSDHNLWIVDDLLAYYQFFASDKTLTSFIDESDSTLEPDAVFFNPMGFHREGTNDPVVLVEFKRPGDETTSNDPVDQVLGYIEKLRGKTARNTITGEVMSEISQDTPFMCYIICDLTETMRRKFGRSLAPHKTPDGEGYFGYAPEHKAVIHVMSYKKMFRDAEIRNLAFFKQLGLVTNR